MLENLLLTVIIGFAVSYIVVKVAVWWVDWDCRRSNTPESRQRWVEGLLDQGRTEYILALGRHPANTPEDREAQFREWDTPDNRETWPRARKNKPIPSQGLAHTGSSRPY